MASEKRYIRLAAILAIATLTFAGCATPPESATETESTIPAPPVPLSASINAVMVGLVDHASHSIWDAAVPEKAPKDDKAWEEVGHHAIQLVAAGSVIAMPGTGKSDAAWVKNLEWQQYAKELVDSGNAALEATRNKDTKALSDAGDKLVMTCEGCHEAYKGELPTEGILHPH